MAMSRDISPDFLKSDTQTPFDSCLVCSKDVISSGEDYFIERIMRRVPDFGVTETLFEYAMCMDCASNMKGEMSKESMQSIEAFFKERIMSLDPFDRLINPLEKCLLTGKRIDESLEFSFHAHCRGAEMMESIFPYAVSDDAMDQISELLSKETLDELDEFKGKYFNGPPEIAELINPKRLLPI